MKKILISAMLIFAASFAVLKAQSKEELNYRKASEQLRKDVFAWDQPQFKIREVPEKYKNASKVILARHTELIADSKSKFKFYVVSFYVKKEQTITEVVREIIKVNDKKAVEYYSELSFTQFAKTSGFFYDSKATTYVGVRIIKPNGAIKEINADDIVLTKDEKREKKARLAVPDLQAGDIIDYFIATESLMADDLSNKPYQVFLFDESPILNLSFHAQLGKKWSIEYRSYNGAPELAVSKNDDKDIIADVKKTNIEPFETTLWVAPAKQLPFIRMNISMGYRGMGSKYMNTKKPGEISKNTDSEEFLEAKANDFSYKFYYEYLLKTGRDQYSAIEADAKKKAKQSGINYKELNEDEKAAYLFYTFRFNYLLNFGINNMQDRINGGQARYNGFALPLYALFKTGGLEPAMLVSPTHYGLPFSEILSEDDLATYTYLPASKKFFRLNSIYDACLEAPENIDGVSNTKSFIFRTPKLITSVGKAHDLTNIENGINVPASTALKNAHIENLTISLGKETDKLTVERSTVVKGFYKADAQSRLILYEDFYDHERKAFHIEKSLTEELEDGKKSKKYVDEVKNAFSKARKEQKEAFEEEAAEWFEQEVTDLKNHKTDNLGVRHDKPDFVYSSSFDLAGLIKKAGNNYIVEIGKIQGTPLLVKEDQRKRDLDIYMPYARSIEYNIEFQIPEGYSAEGIPSLNKSEKNETGFFTVEASSTDKLITLIVKKHYLHNFELARNWDKLIAFTDASSEWADAKFLLKKK